MIELSEYTNLNKEIPNWTQKNYNQNKLLKSRELTHQNKIKGYHGTKIG